MYNVKESDIEIKTPATIEVPGTKSDSTDRIKIPNVPDLKPTGDSLGTLKIDTTKKNKTDKDVFNVNFGRAVQYKTINEYDSAERSMPKNKRDNWFVRLLTKKSITINQRYKGKENTLMVDLSNKFIHSVPYILFASLPLFALFLKLLYIRRKQFYYADHGVFLIHLYIFTFLFMLLWFLLDKLEKITNWKGIGWVQALLVLIGLFYTLKGLKNFYGQGWGKTILKFILFNVFCLLAAVILFVVFGFFSFYQI